MTIHSRYGLTRTAWLRTYVLCCCRLLKIVLNYSRLYIGGDCVSVCWAHSFHIYVCIKRYCLGCCCCCCCHIEINHRWLQFVEFLQFSFMLACSAYTHICYTSHEVLPHDARMGRMCALPTWNLNKWKITKALTAKRTVTMTRLLILCMSLV